MSDGELLILASASPRRRELLLDQLGVTVSVSSRRRSMSPG